MTEPRTLARNATVEDLVAILRTNQARKLDVVVPASKIRSEGGVLVVSDMQELTNNGVTTVDGHYLPTTIADDQIGEKLGIPPGYLSTMRTKRVDLYDLNVNGWLHGCPQVVERNNTLYYKPAEPDQRNFLLRLFRPGDDGELGVARAVLSDNYKRIEDLDTLMTVLEGIREAGVQAQVHSADLTDRRMYVRLIAPAITAMATTLLRNYRSPFSGAAGIEDPIVFAGLEASNSEVGHGAFQVAPYILIKVCKNGMSVRNKAIRAQHLGQKLEVGQIDWSEATKEKNLALVQSMTVDAIRSFLSADWLEKTLAEIESKCAVEVAKPEETIKVVAQKLRYTEAQQDDILRMFIRGGDLTTGGVMQAVTASAQNQADADKAADMEGDALRVLDLAVANARL